MAVAHSIGSGSSCASSLSIHPLLSGVNLPSKCSGSASNLVGSYTYFSLFMVYLASLDDRDGLCVYRDPERIGYDVT